MIERIERTLELARQEVNRQNAPLALEYLASIEDDVEGIPGTAAWAEFELVRGEALLGERHPSAGSCLIEALNRIGTLPTKAPALSLRANKAYAAFLDRDPDLRLTARKYYDMARQIAIEGGFREDNALCTLRIIKIDLQRNKDPQLENFRLFKKVADGEYTAQEQLATWLQYLGEHEQTQEGRTFARSENLASERYFRKLLESVRDKCNEEESDK